MTNEILQGILELQALPEVKTELIKEILKKEYAGDSYEDLVKEYVALDKDPKENTIYRTALKQALEELKSESMKKTSLEDFKSMGDNIASSTKATRHFIDETNSDFLGKKKGF